MVRIILENLVLLILPSVLYFTYIYLTMEKGKARRAAINDAPFIWLFIAGVGLAIAVLVTFATDSGSRPGEVYRPAVYKDGKIVPGELLKQDEEQSKSPAAEDRAPEAGASVSDDK